MKANMNTFICVLSLCLTLTRVFASPQVAVPMPAPMAVAVPVQQPMQMMLMNGQMNGQMAMPGQPTINDNGVLMLNQCVPEMDANRFPRLCLVGVFAANLGRCRQTGFVCTSVERQSRLGVCCNFPNAAMMMGK